MRAPQGSGWGQRPPDFLEQRIVVERDGKVTARSGKVEYGQGIRTGFARIVAQELGLPLDSVTVELGETARVPWDMGTFGSMSTATEGASLRNAAILARRQLLDRASSRLALRVDELTVANGRIVARDGRALSFVELTQTEPLAGLVPADVRGGADSASPAQDIPLRLEGRAIVTGTARYPADVRLPDQLYGHVLHPPNPDAKLLDLDISAAEGLPGVVAIVREDDFVGVVVERERHLRPAIAALKAKWGLPSSVAAAPVDLALRRDDGVAAAFVSTSRHVSARYHLPHIAHASIGPSAAVADVRDGHADLYVATQRPFGLREEVADVLGIDPEAVEVHPQMMGGMYGRGNMNGAAIEAARLSRSVGRPVLVQWSREDEFRFSPHRPVLGTEVEAAVSEEGRILAWRYRARTNPHTYGFGGGAPRVAEVTAGRNMIPPYRIERMEATLHVEAAPIRTGAFRSLAASMHVFAIESFMDEVACALGQDPIAFRLALVDDPRLVRVLETVRERSGWRDGLAGNRGRGVACAIYNGTYVAEVAEVSVGDDDRVRLDRAWCAVDAGRLVNPDGARNQIEGGVQQAASWTLLEELTQENGEVTTITWRDYPIARATDAPRAIDVTFTGDPGTPSSGIGEPGSVPTAAAIANAVYAATGVRRRELPLNRRPR